MDDFKDDFTKKPRVEDLPGVRVDHETGMIHIPGQEPLPMVGPTSGQAYEDLKTAERQFKRDKNQLMRWMKSLWQCTQCKKVWIGERVRIKKAAPGVEDVVFVCADQRCDAPVTLLKDAGEQTGDRDSGKGGGSGSGKGKGKV